ncbi:type II toxin-antitoxin system RelE/ParE family toxin [Fuerstiella marisgermanici]|uniref:Plasmid stabilization system protein n=1 Tax=Fuerstiella marisgermanici TaxID=1891926 RepID=A0A1P8WKH7_9PLAN|nr:type II toxin-antitoxin system RelE/ParE family toxin [Fuerstiella marisgermanici]APZ94560.1 Plasmid stabilization system protein [Fuerstiella marisgermanici]
MANIVLCSAAEIDYTESLTWYAEHSTDAANDFDAEFDRALAQIVADPHRFPMCDARHHYFLLRRYPFRIIYRTVQKDIVVIALAHSSRAPDYWADR